MRQAVDYDPFAAGELELAIPATPAQQEIWAATRFDPLASRAFNESVTLRLDGALDRAALQQALHALAARHPALRSTFSPDDATLCVAASQTMPLHVDDLSGLPPQAQAARVQAIVAEEVEKDFDLEHGPLAGARLLVLGPREHRLIFTAHHIVCDGWSAAVLLGDLARLYSGRGAELQPPPSFREYAAVLRAGAEKARAYWLDRLGGELPGLHLPTDRPRPPLRTFGSRRCDRALPASLVGELKKLGARHNASFFTVLLTGFAAFLSRLSSAQDLVIGVPAAGQSMSGMHDLVGHCVNLLPVRCSVDPGASFAAHLQAFRTLVLDAYDHQQITYGELLPSLQFRRDSSLRPLVSVAFNLDQAVQTKDLPFEGLEVEYRSNPRHFENFEWFINASEANGRVVLECQYNTDLFDAATLADRLESFEALLADAAARPAEPLSLLSLLSQAQQEQVLVEWNATAREYARTQTVGELLHSQAERTPDRLALTCDGATWTYGELDRRANQLAHVLREQGVQPGGLVGFCLDRTLDAVAALLAILRAGAGYVPLDPRYPRERLAFMLRDSGATLLLTEHRHARLLAEESVRSIIIETAAEAIRSAPAEPPPGLPRPTDTAYVIYTSGSTGVPKGVPIAHSGVVNLLTSMQAWPGIGSEDVLVAVTTFSFDMSVTEILLPLSCGAHVVLAGAEVVSDGRRLAALLEASGATLMQGTPASWRLLLRAGWAGSPRLTAWTGGEALAPELARELLGRSRALWNLYGPTETTVYSTGTQILDPDRITIGKPLANTQAYVLDGRLQPVPVGVPGELYLGGAGLTRGYWNRPDLTAERFVENPYHDPFADYLNGRLYRTGDLARWTREGALEYLGRNDHQVKLRGMRIELGEIEAALGRHAAVRQCVAALRLDQADDPRLAAYYTTHAGQLPTATELRRHLRAHLPEYMVPQHFVELDALPLTANGKVDRQALPPPNSPREHAARGQTPRPSGAGLSPRQRYFLKVCGEVLAQPGLGLEDNWFQVGGHSLLAMQLLARIEKDTGVRLEPRWLLHSSLGSIAERLPPDRVQALL